MKRDGSFEKYKIVLITETEAIVLRTLKYGETSIIAEVFTLHDGIRSIIVNGVRSTRNKSGSSSFQVMNILSLSYYNKESDTLCRTKEYQYAVHYKRLGLDVIYTSVGIFLIECVRNAVQEREENQPLYLFLKERFLTDFYLYFLVDLSTLLGFGPLPNYEAKKPCFHLLHGRFTESHHDPVHLVGEGPSQILFHILKSNRMDGLLGTKQDKDQLTDDLLRYYGCHLEGFRPIRSLEVLRTIMR